MINNYSNLFDACIKQKTYFEELRQKKNNINIYINYLNACSGIFEKSFNTFIERYNGTLSLHNLATFKKKIKKFLVNINPEQPMAIININRLPFGEALLSALKEEKAKSTNQLIYEYPNISTILNVRMLDLHKYNHEKNKENLNEKLGNSLNEFCMYALMFNNCYAMVENLH